MSGKKENIHPRLINNKHAIILLFCLILATIIYVKIPYATEDYLIGGAATGTIRAPYDFLVGGSGATIKKGEIIVREGQRISSS